MDQITRKIKEALNLIKKKKNELAYKRSTRNITLEEVRQLKSEIRELHREIYKLRLENLKKDS